MKKLLLSLPVLVVLVAIGLCTFGATAFAATEVTGSADSSSLLDLLKPVYDAFSGGHYAYAAALGVIVLVALIKKYFGDKISFLHTNAGGSLMALVVASATALAAALAAPDATVTIDGLKSALLVGVGAAGGYAVLKNLLIDPFLVPLLSRYSWGAPFLAVINVVFGRGNPAVADAEKAGSAAVEAKPATGIAGTVKPTELK